MLKKAQLTSMMSLLPPAKSLTTRSAIILYLYFLLGLLGPGGTVVEGTAGNTGIGLAHMCLALGYKCVIYMPDDQSQEKIDAIRVLGADVRPVPRFPFNDPRNFNKLAMAHADAMENAVWTNQFDNRANRRAHYQTTGPEIWEQTNGKVDAVVFGTGTGGTLAGSSMFLKERNKDIKAVAADPQGSVLYSYFTTGKVERTGNGSITEGMCESDKNLTILYMLFYTVICIS